MLLGWPWTTTGTRNTEIDFDIESTPLQIQTDSVVGSGDYLWVRFLDTNSEGAGIDIKFTDPPSNSIGYCIPRVNFTMPGAEKYRIWTFIKQDNTLQLLCNGVEIFNFNYSDLSTECWWSKDIAKIAFPSNEELTDTASDYYRSFKDGMLVNFLT